jgi:hypothetical protein
MDFVQGASVVSQLDNTVATLVAAANPQGTGTVAMLKRAAGSTLAAAGAVEASATVGAALFWASVRINAITIAGTITANIRALESAIAANYGVGCKVYKISGNAIAAAFAQGSNLTEIGTAEAASSIALTPTSTVFTTGDRIGVLFFFVGVGGSVAGQTARMFWNGAAGASGDTFLSFTETITAYAKGKIIHSPSQAIIRTAVR